VNKSLITPMPPTKWYDGLAQYQHQGIAHVLATVVAVNGSAPRELQSKMIVTLDDRCDTLGGGSLEHDVTITARQLLNGEIDANEPRGFKPLKEGKSEKAQAVRRDAVYTKHYPLGATLAQCCGGSVTVMFECFNVIPPMSLLVFGGGHVAAALMTVLAELPCQIDWVDSRPEMFERYLTDESVATDQKIAYNLPAHIRPHIEEDPVDFIQPFVAKSIKSASINASMKKGTQYYILVMTHDHSLDFDLVRATLDAYVKIGFDDSSTLASLPYLGCISSATKAKRFRDRLLQRDYNEQTVDNLTMPIGLALGGKEPMAVAVSIAAQILQQYHNP
tara:strand:+ start:312 stop:1310 length:999 start_codon:yes stop_codon:yes gene_type:complete